MVENSITLRKKLKEKYVRELIESLPTIELVPLPEDFLSEILFSGLIILAGRQQGKTNVAKVILREVINTQNGNVRVKITDSCQNFVHDFEPIYYQCINDETEFPGDIYFGDDHFLYDIEYQDVELIQDTIGMLVATDSDIQRIYKKHDVMDNWILWCIEEAQNVLGTYALNGKQGKRWLKMISESANFHMNFIFIGQRAADISTKAVERCQSYLLGKMTGDNDLKKVRRICGKDSGVDEIVPTLKRGEFIYWNGAEARKVINIPRYESERDPVLWRGEVGFGF